MNILQSITSLFIDDGDLHTFVVEKPYCCPPREIILAALHPIGIPIYDLRQWSENISLATFAQRMKIELRTFENLQYGPLAPGFLPMSCRASFSVPAARANQAEYWLLRTQRLLIVKGAINPRNQLAADKHNGIMPRASDPKRGEAYARKREGNDPDPRLESTCTQAHELWRQVNELAKQAKQPKEKTATKKTNRKVKTKTWSLW